MKKNYTTPELQVTRFVVENEITVSADVDMTQNLLFTTTGEGENKVDAVKVVNYAQIFNIGA